MAHENVRQLGRDLEINKYACVSKIEFVQACSRPLEADTLRVKTMIAMTRKLNKKRVSRL